MLVELSPAEAGDLLEALVDAGISDRAARDLGLTVVRTSPVRVFAHNEQALARARKRIAAADTPGDPGRPHTKITKATLLELFARGLERARSKRPQPSYAAIADEHELKRTWVTPIVKWAEKHPSEAREAIASSKTPERFSTIVSD